MLTDYIAQIIDEMLNESGGNLEIRRNEMAMKLGCVPSQISYVISSRFTPEKGYIIESRKGGGGCIRIVRKQMHKNEYLMHFFCAIGETIEEKEALAFLKNLYDHDIISVRELQITSAAISEAALSYAASPHRQKLRADIFKHMILALM